MAQTSTLRRSEVLPGSFHLHRLKVAAWRLRRLPAAKRKQAGKQLLADIKHFLDLKINDLDLPRSDL